MKGLLRKPVGGILLPAGVGQAAGPVVGRLLGLPSVPTGLAAGTATATSVPLSWTANAAGEQVDNYQVYRDGVQIAAAVTGTSYTDATVAASTSYAYRITAHNATGFSGQATAVNVTTPAGTGTLPTGPAGTATAQVTIAAAKTGALTIADIGADHAAASFTGNVTGVSGTGLVASGNGIDVRIFSGANNESGDDRVEFTTTGAQFTQGQSFWFGYSFKMDTFPAANTWEVIHQFFGETSPAAGAGSPPFALEINANAGNQLQATIRGGAKSSAGVTAPFEDADFLGTVAANTPVFVLAYLKMSTMSGSTVNPNGVVHVWRRNSDGTWPTLGTTGTSVWDNIQFGFTLAGTPTYFYQESGVYRQAQASVQHLTLGNVITRSTPAAVAAFFA